MNKKFGFTLSEILISLGILGVVAALTVPALMTNVEKGQWSTGLKTSKGSIERAFTQMLATNGVDSLDATPLWQDLSESEKVMKELFKVEKKDKGKLSDKILQINSNANFTGIDNYESYALANGTFVYIDFHDAQPGEIYADVYIDTNGIKPPNTLGKDIFAFALINDGRLLPYGSDELNEINPVKYPKWDTVAGCKGKEDEIQDGRLCTARLASKGYDFDY